MPTDTPSAARPSLAGQPTAGWGVRIGALVIDWLSSSLVAYAIDGGHGSSFLPLVVYLVEASLGTASVGASFGQLVTRLRVVNAEGPRVGGTLHPVAALVRTVLICLVIPPVVFRPDGRGLHDLAVGSRVVRSSR